MERRNLVDRNDQNFSLRRQCELLKIHRSGIYYCRQGVSESQLVLMRAIDEEYLKHPFYGRRRMTLAMRKQGFDVGEKCVRNAMVLMGLEAIYPRPNLSRPNKKHKKYPYLMRHLKVSRPNQAWAADITYIPLSKGFGYLFAIIDWFSRYVVEWNVSPLLETEFCLESLERAFFHATPEIFNTDQGAQFTSLRFTERLERGGVRISIVQRQLGLPASDNYLCR